MMWTLELQRAVRSCSFYRVSYCTFWDFYLF